MSSELVLRVEAGVGPRKGPFAPNIAVRAISAFGAASQNAIDIEEHAKSSAQYREGWPNHWRNLQPYGRYQWEVFVSYLMFCDVSSAVSPGLCPDAPLLRVKCSICFCLSPSVKSNMLYIRFSGMYPSTTATAPTLPASAEPLSSEMTEITSAGSTKCQLANVCLELAPTVTEKTWSLGSLDCRSERNMSVIVSSKSC